jgi:hypothetical protein
MLKRTICCCSPFSSTIVFRTRCESASFQFVGELDVVELRAPDRALLFLDGERIPGVEVV